MTDSPPHGGLTGAKTGGAMRSRENSEISLEKCQDLAHDLGGVNDSNPVGDGVNYNPHGHQIWILSILTWMVLEEYWC